MQEVNELHGLYGGGIDPITGRAKADVDLEEAYSALSKNGLLDAAFPPDNELLGILFPDEEFLLPGRITAKRHGLVLHTSHNLAMHVALGKEVRLETADGRQLGSFTIEGEHR